MVVVHKIAQCQECEFEEQDYNTAYKKAVNHSKKTGHEITIETAHVLRIKNGKSITKK